MKKYIQKLSHFFNLSRSMLIFLIGLLIVGVISGSLFSVVIINSDQKIVNDYLGNFISLIQNNKLNNINTLFNSVMFNYIYAVIIWMLGISLIGLPIIVFMYFGKSFTLGFTISTIIKNYGLKGCLISLGYTFPHCIINIFIFSILTLYSATLSLKMIKCILGRKTIDFKSIMRKYLYIGFISLIILLFTSLYESFLMPNIIKFLLKFI